MREFPLAYRRECLLVGCPHTLCLCHGSFSFSHSSAGSRQRIASGVDPGSETINARASKGNPSLKFRRRTLGRTKGTVVVM
jgi:hypothetical protein